MSVPWKRVVGRDAEEKAGREGRNENLRTDMELVVCIRTITIVEVLVASLKDLKPKRLVLSPWNQPPVMREY